MSTANYGSGWPGLARSQHYTLPVSIPPGQSRYLRLMWTSDLCAEAGGTASTDQVKLLVRVGWITRTEDVGLGQAWAVTGTKQSTC